MKQVLSYFETIESFGFRKNLIGNFCITVKVKRNYWDTNTGWEDHSTFERRNATEKDMIYYKSYVHRLAGSEL